MPQISLQRIYLLLLLITGLGVGIGHALTQRYDSQNLYILAPTQWEYAFSASDTPPSLWQKASKLQFLTRISGKDLWLKTSLPHQEMRAPSLWVRRLNQNFEVFQGQQAIYRFGDLHNAPSQFNGYSWHMISLPADIVANTVQIHLHSEHRFVGIMSPVFFGSQSQLIRHLITQNLGVFMLGCLFSLIGFFALILGLFLPDRFLSFMFGLFCLLLGIYTLCESDLIGLWLPQAYFLTYLSLTSLYFMPGCIYLFIRRLSGFADLQLPIQILAFVHLSYAGMAILAVLMGFPLMQTVLPFQILILIALFVLSGFLFRFWQRLDAITHLVATGILIFIATTLHDLLVAIHWLSASMQLYPWGCFMFVVALLLALFQRFATIYHGQIQVGADLKASLATQAELKLAKEQAEEASRLKSQFLANLSHEIRTPLNAVMGFSELLEEELTEPQHRGYLDAIYSGGKALLGLLNDLLDLSKIEAGKLSLELQPCDLHLLCQELLQLFSLPLKKKNIQWSLHYAADIPSVFVIDELRVRQILLNLIGNAVKFTDQGQITLSVKAHPLNDQQLELSLSLEDSGVGIPPEAQELIFEPFRQQDGQSTRKYGGTGLGLAICRRLAQLMGGDIFLASVVGQGSVFTLSFPVASSTEGSSLLLANPIAIEKPVDVTLTAAKKEALRKHLEPLYLETQKKRNLKLIRRLADETQIWGQSEDNQAIKLLGQELELALQQFDIEQVNYWVAQIRSCWD
jgi:signal transduction histidine kinase